MTHVLLAVSCLLRRADGVEVIGAALTRRAAGEGHRPIAAALGRPAATVRGWQRALGRNAVRVRAVLMALLVQLDPLTGAPSVPGGVGGKIERLFRTVREQFLVEITADQRPADLTELNTLFTAWVETVYHRRAHTETGQTPLQRWSMIGAPTLPTPAQLREAFLWSEWRPVTKTATVGLHGNSYEVDAALVGRRVELVFDPFDLTRIEVRWHGRGMGAAVPHRIDRHVYAKARPDPTTISPPAATGIDYLALVQAQHTAELAERVRYAHLPDQPLDTGPGTTDRQAAL